ncbi:MAG: hypothetical protein ACR2IV_05655 [Bryobacteraceae bacterium]
MEKYITRVHGDYIESHAALHQVSEKNTNPADQNILVQLREYRTSHEREHRLLDDNLKEFKASPMMKLEG